VRWTVGGNALRIAPLPALGSHPVAVAHVRHSDHATGQLGWRFVELIQLLEVGDFAGNDSFVHAFGAIAFKHVRRQGAVPFATKQFDDLGGLDVKVSWQLPGQVQSVYLAARFFQHDQDFIGYGVFHWCSCSVSHLPPRPRFQTGR
jgi:hypothetical protein